MGADIAADTSEAAFHWLVGTLLLSARIDAAIAVRAGRRLRELGLHRVDGLLGAEEETLAAVLDEAGYARHEHVTAERLKATARTMHEAFGGDLRRARDGTAASVLAAVTSAKGIGETGAAIFAREMQLVWDELHPRLDGPAEGAARDLGLPAEARALAGRAGSRERFVRLVAALTRVALDGPAERVREAARA
jgi:hypothetical protein